MEYSYLFLTALLSGAIIMHLATLVRANRAVESRHTIDAYEALAIDAVLNTAQNAAEFAQGTGALPPFQRLADDSVVSFNRLVVDFSLPPLGRASSVAMLRSAAFRLFTPPTEEEASADRRGTEA